MRHTGKKPAMIYLAKQEKARRNKREKEAPSNMQRVGAKSSMGTPISCVYAI
jgi:hypothetical protein